MSYDVAKRKKPVPFRICNYGLKLEEIRFGILSKSGLDMNPPPMEMHSLGFNSNVFLISNPIKHPDLQEYYLAIEVIDMDEAGCVESKSDPIFVLEILAISPKSCKPSTLEHASEMLKADSKFKIDENGMEVAYDLAQYGKAAHLWQACGDNLEELIAEAKKRLQKIESLIGFYLDQPQNRMGDSGWSWVGDF
jgi:hypothetical protein